VRSPYSSKSYTSIDPGTYRAPDGRLVHCRRELDSLTIEFDEMTSGAAAFRLDDLVLLSDDPDWPDWQHRPADASLFVD